MSNTVRDLPTLSRNHMAAQKLENEALKAELASLRASLVGLKTLCVGSKFSTNPYINVADVLNWAQQADNAACDANGNVYTYARMRQVLVTESAANDAGYVKLTAERVTSQSYEHAEHFVYKPNLDMALDVLKSDGWDSVQIDTRSYNGDWRYERRVRL